MRNSAESGFVATGVYTWQLHHSWINPHPLGQGIAPQWGFRIDPGLDVADLIKLISDIFLCRWSCSNGKCCHLLRQINLILSLRILGGFVWNHLNRKVILINIKEQFHCWTRCRGYPGATAPESTDFGFDLRVWSLRKDATLCIWAEAQNWFIPEDVLWA